jgi:outer membrane protein assembly factor BamD (BamD/ComL family)
VRPQPAPELRSESLAAVPAEDVAWQRLADQSEYAQALEALATLGGFDVVMGAAGAEQLLALADVARATGQRERAVVALRRLVSEHGADPNAPVAAWMLGNELSKAGDLAGAAHAFATYRSLSPGGDFAEDALARQIDLAAEQGQVEPARRLAGRYLEEFPDGPRSADIQAKLERWGRVELPAPEPESGDPPAAPAEPGAPR